MNDDKTIVSIEEQIEKAKVDAKKKYGKGAMSAAAAGGVVFGAGAVAIPLSVFPRKEEIPEVETVENIDSENEQNAMQDVIVAEAADSTANVDAVVDEVPTEVVSGSDEIVENIVDIADSGLMPIAHNVSDSMSFGEAFATARAEVGAGGIFEWRGNTYGTYYKDEWDAMSPSEKDEYWASVNETVGNGNSGYGYENYADSSNNLDVLDVMDVDGDGKEDAWLVDVNDDGVGDAIIMDVDGDGNGDVVLFDANGNDTPDFIVDLNGDGNMELILDAEIGADGNLVYDEANVLQIDSINNNVAQGHDNGFVDDIDLDAQEYFDPNIPIDNNMNMDGMV